MSEIVRTRDELAQAMRADGLPVDTTISDDRLVFPLVDDNIDTTAILIWPPHMALVQLMLPLRFEIPVEHMAAVCEGAVRLNHVLVLPGFGVDVDRGMPYFRSVQPREPDGSLSVDAVRRMVQAAASTAAQFTHVLALVASGELAPADIESTL